MPVGHKDKIESIETKIGINAHLLSPKSGYRRAGIHQYISQVLHHLPLLNDSTNYTVFTRNIDAVGGRRGVRVVPSRWPTERRTVRILWEQSVWPLLAAKENIDLLHSMAFVSPVIGQIPTIVTVYDLSFVHFPEKFPALQRLYLHSQTARSVKQARRIITISEASRQDLHHFFDALAIAHGMDHGADAADPFHDLYHLMEISFFSQFFQASVDISESGHSLFDDFILHGQRQVDGFGQHGVLGTEGYNCFSHGIP